MRLPSQRPLRSPAAGFTLMEILLVVGIIAILMGIVITNGPKIQNAAKITATQAKVKQLQSNLNLYETNNKTLPSTDQGLRALIERPSGNPQPRMWTSLCKEEQLFDSWKRPFHYRCPSRDGNEPFEVWSDGPDGKSETSDDISSSDE